MWKAGKLCWVGRDFPSRKEHEKNLCVFFFFSINFSQRGKLFRRNIRKYARTLKTPNYWNDLMVSLLNMQVIQDEHTLKRWSYSSVSVRTTLPSQHFEKPHTPPKFNIAVLGAGDCIFTSQLFWYVKLRGWRCWIFFTIFQHQENLTQQEKGSTGFLLQDAFPKELPSKGSALHAYRTWDWWKFCLWRVNFPLLWRIIPFSKWLITMVSRSPK